MDEARLARVADLNGSRFSKSVSRHKFASFPELNAGGFSRLNTTVRFYTRVASLLSPEMTVLDYGAGRGEGVIDEYRLFVRNLRNLRGRVRRVIGVDLDHSVMTNPTLDEAHIICADQGGRTVLPFQDGEIDLIVCDWTFEHISNPGSVSGEFYRVLSEGGWVCARTPNKWGYIAVGSRAIPFRLRHGALRRLQPNRLDEDIFPTHYAINTMAALRRYFSEDRWSHCSYHVDADPAYAGENPVLWRLFRILSALTPSVLRPVTFVFMQRRTTRS